MSIRDPCGLLRLSRSGYYYEIRPVSAENLALMLRMDQLHLAHSVFGSCKLVKWTPR